LNIKIRRMTLAHYWNIWLWLIFYFTKSSNIILDKKLMFYLQLQNIKVQTNYWRPIRKGNSRQTNEIVTSFVWVWVTTISKKKNTHTHTHMKIKRIGKNGEVQQLFTLPNHWKILSSHITLWTSTRTSLNTPQFVFSIW